MYSNIEFLFITFSLDFELVSFNSWEFHGIDVFITYLIFSQYEKTACEDFTLIPWKKTRYFIAENVIEMCI